MNKFQIENLDFCQSARDDSASVITGAFRPVVVVAVKVDTLVRVKGTAAFAAGAGAAGAAAGIDGQPLVMLSMRLGGSFS